MIGRRALASLAIAAGCHAAPATTASPTVHAPAPSEAPPASAPVGPSTFRGLFIQGFETEAFRPCDEPVSWWVTGTEALHERYRAVAERPYDAVYAVVRGTVGPAGTYGHMGGYVRELAVVEVVEVRLPERGECGYATETKAPPP